MKKISQYYEEFARAMGYKDWNTLCGLESEERKLEIKKDCPICIRRRQKQKQATRRWRKRIKNANTIRKKTTSRR